MRRLLSRAVALTLLCGAIGFLLALLTGCFTEPKPEYCYRWGAAESGGEPIWYCEGHATYPADTLPDDLKDKYQPPVVSS